MGNIVIGASRGYSWEQIRPWVTSLRRTGFEGDQALIIPHQDGHLAQVLDQHDVLPIIVNDFDPFNERFGIIGMVLDRLFKNHDYALVTDVRDVVFQNDPFDYIRANVYATVVVSEGLRYLHETWNHNNLASTFPEEFQTVVSQIIYNVGVIGGRRRAVAGLCKTITAFCNGRPSPADQAALNVLLQTEPINYNIMECFNSEGFCCHCGTFADPSKIEEFRPNLIEPEPVWDGKQVKTHDGVPYAIVHQYDRVPEWRDVLAAL